MSGLLKVLGFLALPLILGVGSIVFGKDVSVDSTPIKAAYFFTSSLSSSWAVVLGMAIALPIFLSQWVKIWVIWIVYALFALILFFAFSAMSESAAPCYMLSGMYALLGVACLIGWTDKVAPVGIGLLSLPVVVWVVLVAVLDLGLSFVYLADHSMVHIYLMLSGFLGGAVVAAVYRFAFLGDAAGRNNEAAQKASMAHMYEVNKVHQQVASAPVGERPKISVLDMKMAAVVDDPSENDTKVTTTAKIFVENQDG